MITILEEYKGQALPKVATRRLVLRQWTEDDVEDLFAYARLPIVANPAGFPPIKTLEEEREYITDTYIKRQKEQDLPLGYGITIKGSHRVIGSCDFNHRQAEDSVEIGYILHPDFWGQGYMPEAVAALIEVGFTLLHLSKIELKCFCDNWQSQRVAEKLGFQLEGLIEDGKKDHASHRERLRYRLSKTEWEKNKAASERL